MSYKWSQLGRGGSTPRSPFSRALRRAVHLINERKLDRALTLLDKAAPHAQTAGQRAKVASLVARTQFILGRYDACVVQYEKAIQLAKTEVMQQDHWLPAVCGKIRALLKGQNVDEAVAEARAASSEAEDRVRDFETRLNASIGQLQQSGSLRVGAKPLRLNTVLTKLASVFWEDGYTDQAKVNLQRAISLTPNGASRARQLLATILLQEGKAAEAEQLARESLLMGRFQAKTVASWPLLIEARALQGKPLLDPQVFDALLSSGNGAVAERSKLLVLGELRRRGDEMWRTIASNSWAQGSTTDVVSRFETGKILLSEARLRSDHAEAFRLANFLLSAPELSGSESVQLAKACVEAGLLTGLLGDEIASIRDQISHRFGQPAAARAVHGMALSAMMAKSYDLARSLLTGLFDSVDLGTTQWSRSKWALGRMEKVLGNNAQAAAHFLDVSEASGVPPRFRLQAFLNWLGAAKMATTSIDLDAARQKIIALVSDIDQAAPLLDAARLLSLAGDEFQDILAVVAEAGEKKAIEAFQSCKESTQAAAILNHLARRQFYDLQRSAQLVGFWEALPNEKIDWLWGKDARFWEYVGLVGDAYLDIGRIETGERFLRTMLAEDTVPRAGRIYLLITLANWFVEEGRWLEAWGLYEDARRESPEHRLTAHACYWIGLKAYAGDDAAGAAALASTARKCLAPRPALQWEWALDAKAALLLSRLHRSKTQVDTRLFKEDFLTRMSVELDGDLNRLRP